jgi:hypothetical protein
VVILNRKLRDLSVASISVGRVSVGPPSVRSFIRVNQEEDNATQMSFNENENNDICIPDRIKHIEERLTALRLKLSQVDSDLAKEEHLLGSSGDATSSPATQQLSRNKSILVLHVAELRAEKRVLEYQLKGDFKEVIVDDSDLIDYPALIDKFIDNKEILEFISKLVNWSD